MAAPILIDMGSGEGKHTLPSEETEHRHRTGRTFRRIAVSVMALFVFVGAAGFLGVKTDNAAASAGGYTLSVDYGRISRPGLNTPLRVNVVHAGGFSGPVTLGITQSYMSLFDLNGLYPNPSAMTVDGDTLLMEFDPPNGDVLGFTLDARMGPSVQTGKRATISVVEDGVPVVSVEVTTKVVP